MSETPTVLGRPDISISASTARLGDQTFELSEISTVSGYFRYQFFNHHGCMLAATYLSLFFILPMLMLCGLGYTNPEYSTVVNVAAGISFISSLVAFVLLYRTMKHRPHRMTVVDSEGNEHHYIVPNVGHIKALKKACREASKTRG